VHGLEAKYSGQVEFVYLDIDDSRNDEFKRQFGYQYQPHLFLLDGQGNILNQWVGLVDEATLDSALAAAAGSG
jgi:hypothetical protein